MRKTFTIAAIVIVVAGIGAAAYFYNASRQPDILITPTTTTLPLASDTAPAPATTQPIPTAATVPGRLAKITAGPVSLGEAVTAVPPKDASSTPDVAVHFIERQSGNVYRYLVRAGTLTRTSNRTVPGIQSAAWLPNGSLAFVRYLSGADFSTINTYGLSATGGAGFFLPQNLSDISVASTSILMLSSGVNGSVASLARPDGTASKQVFATPLSQLRASLLGKTEYLAVTKSSWAVAGTAYRVDAAGRFSRIAGPQSGLAALPSPLGKWVLVSYVSNDTLQLELVSMATMETIPLPVGTIADKCVWTAGDEAVYCGVPQNPPPGRYPDDWYQGAVSFSDRIWKIDVEGRFAQLVLDFSKEDTGAFDVTGLAIDKNVSVISFVNKLDGSLWAYSL